MRKILYILLVFGIVLGSTISFASPALAASMPGAIWTSDSAGKTIDQNLYAAKTDVYLNGGPPNSKSAGLPGGDYYVQVTATGGGVLGKTLTASVHVGVDGKIGLVQLWSILYRASSGFTVTGYDNTTNNGGEYKVWVSKDPAFSNDQSKTDNFKVKPVLGTIIVKKNTLGSNDIFNFTATGGNGLPGSFSIATSGNTGLTIYDVSPGTFGINEIVSSDWILTSSSVSPTYSSLMDASKSTTTSTTATTTATRTTSTTTTTTATKTTRTTTTTPVINPGNFSVATGNTVTVTFNNKEKAASSTSTVLSTNSIDLYDSVTDTAAVTGTSPTPTGIVTFEVSTDGGATFAPYGAAKTLVSGSATSDPYTPAAAGDNYRFRAVYSGDAKYKVSQSGDQDEPLTVISTSSQRWYLDSNGNPAMEKIPGIQKGSIPVENGTTVTWVSDQAAATSVTFTSGTWKVYLINELYGDYTISIGESDGTSSGFTAFTAARSGTANGQPISVTFTTAGIVPEGHYLTLQITNSGTGRIITDGGSYLAPPAGSPDYPLPEMASVLLFGLGLAGMTGFVIIKRWRPNMKN